MGNPYIGAKPLLTLDEIALKYNTDKSSKGHAYTQYYDMFFSPIRNKEIGLLEIGIWEGASLKMWKDYFPNAHIIGADIEDKSQYEEERVDTVRVDQGSPGDLALMAITYQNSLDIIVDDGSHEAHHQIMTFETLFPILKSGGFYVIEDCLCSFDSRWNSKANVYSLVHEMVDAVNVSGKINSDWICANKKEQVKVLPNLNQFESSIEWVFNSMGLCIIKKL